LKSFAATGISPLNQDVILQRYKEQRERQLREDSSSSTALSSSDWRKINRLISSRVREQATRTDRKISATVHSLQVQVELLTHENKGLREAIATEKKQKKKSYDLDLQQRQEYYGGAVFWSPRKIREARARQVVIERKERDLQLQKEERARVGAANKALKHQPAEEKRVAREEREKEREQERERTTTKTTTKTTQLLRKRGRPALQPHEIPIQRPTKHTREMVGS
jgi:hypothetical protein